MSKRRPIAGLEPRLIKTPDPKEADIRKRVIKLPDGTEKEEEYIVTRAMKRRKVVSRYYRGRRKVIAYEQMDSPPTREQLLNPPKKWVEDKTGIKHTQPGAKHKKGNRKPPVREGYDKTNHERHVLRRKAREARRDAVKATS